MIPGLIVISPEDLETATAATFDKLFGTGWRREVDEMLAEAAAEWEAMAGTADGAFDSVVTVEKRRFYGGETGSCTGDHGSDCGAHHHLAAGGRRRTAGG